MLEFGQASEVDRNQTWDMAWICSIIRIGFNTVIIHINLVGFVSISAMWMILSIGFSALSLKDNYSSNSLRNSARLIAVMAKTSTPPWIRALCTIAFPPLTKRQSLFFPCLAYGSFWYCLGQRTQWEWQCATSEPESQGAFRASFTILAPGIAMSTIPGQPAGEWETWDPWPTSPRTTASAAAIPLWVRPCYPSQLQDVLSGSWASPVYTIWTWSWPQEPPGWSDSWAK